ncbi:MAG: Sir2 family NAD+-dependent deacetylase [Alphaproteobacteria bacterium]
MSNILDTERKTKNIVVLTGAGISQESGIETFRASDGLWAKHNVEDVATPEGFARNPKLVYDFYNLRRRELLNGKIAPNAAHLALARLEEAKGVNLTIVTQNIDNLHEGGGSQNLIHMHGELLKARCGHCESVFEHQEDLDEKTCCPNCNKIGHCRPHIVWFHEMPLEMQRIDTLLETCDLFISIGTSGNVYPAAGFVQQALFAGAETIELNLEPSNTATLFEKQIYGKATQIVPEFVETILEDLI